MTTPSTIPLACADVLSIIVSLFYSNKMFHLVLLFEQYSQRKGSIPTTAIIIKKLFALPFEDCLNIDINLPLGIAYCGQLVYDIVLKP